MLYNPTFMANPEHTKFFCARDENGRAFGLRFDPAMFSDKALKKILWNQMGSVIHAGNSIVIIVSDGNANAEKIRIRPADLLGVNKKERKILLLDMFKKVRREKVTQAVIRKEPKIVKDL